MEGALWRVWQRHYRLLSVRQDHDNIFLFTLGNSRIMEFFNTVESSFSVFQANILRLTNPELQSCY